ncbi:hypothetical protein GEMRC1_005763 [Eukaryota sp. GEM-RC1]
MLTLAFRIHYATVPGETVCVRGNTPELGDMNRTSALRLVYQGDGEWFGSVDIPDEHLKKSPDNHLNGISYRYYVSRPFVDLEEHGDDRVIHFHRDSRLIRCNDTWRPYLSAEDYIAERAVMRRVLCYRQSADQPLEYPPLPLSGSVSVRFSINVPRLDPHHKVVLVGSSTILGSWDSRLGVPLLDGTFPICSVHLNIPNDKLNFEYKYVIVDSEGHPLHWESFENRTFSKGFIPPSTDLHNTICFQDDGTFRYPTSGQFKGFGVICPIFSLQK